MSAVCLAGSSDGSSSRNKGQRRTQRFGSGCRIVLSGVLEGRLGQGMRDGGQFSHAIVLFGFGSSMGFAERLGVWKEIRKRGMSL